MIDHGTTCAGDPCTCSCYTRHEPAPGVHQDTPHPSTQCMSAWQEGYQQGKTDATNRWKQDLQEALDEHAKANREAGIQHDGDIPPAWEQVRRSEQASLQKRHAELPKHNVLCIGCKDCPPDPCPPYCTAHNHEEMGG